MKRLLICLAACVLFMPAAQAQNEPPRFTEKLISIGTASASGTFYGVGSQLCSQVNERRRTNLLRCISYATGGSEYNTKAVEYGELTIGMTRSDLAAREFRERGRFDDAAGDSLRAVMSLHAMPIAVVVRKAAGIDTLEQIRGHVFNVGNRGSGQRLIAFMLLRALGLDEADLSDTTEYSTTEMGAAFCRGEVDVVVEALGHPSSFYRHLIEHCGGRILSMSDDDMRRIERESGRIEHMSIPGGMYAGHPEPVPTMGYKAVLVANRLTSAEAVLRFVQAQMEGFAALRASDPVLAALDEDSIFSDGIHLPLHAGVVQYLRTKGKVQDARPSNTP